MWTKLSFGIHESDSTFQMLVLNSITHALHCIEKLLKLLKVTYSQKKGELKGHIHIYIYIYIFD